LLPGCLPGVDISDGAGWDWERAMEWSGVEGEDEEELEFEDAEAEVDVEER
jgi:hypothetical protein